jgi:flavin reductase (DIM6/NTAB) family NADH-FMN oxidoreductase RutF
MRRFASGVAVVTVDDDGHKLGLTVGSLVSLSLEPPLVGISIGHQSSLHAPLRRARRFAVSLLGGDQPDVAQNLARSIPPIALWSLVPTRPATLREPLIDGALAWLSCRVEHECDAGDHTFFVAEVEDVELGREADALVYARGSFRSA